jgi:hypothetical protein
MGATAAPHITCIFEGARLELRYDSAVSALRAMRDFDFDAAQAFATTTSFRIPLAMSEV